MTNLDHLETIYHVLKQLPSKAGFSIRAWFGFNYRVIPATFLKYKGV